MEDSDQDDFPSINIEDQSEGSKLYQYELTDDNQDLKKDNNSENLNPGFSVCDIDDSKKTPSWKKGDNEESSAENRTFSSEKIGRHVVRNDSHHRRETIIQSVQAVFQEWCTHSTLEYLGLSDDETMTETRLPDEGERGRKSLLKHSFSVLEVSLVNDTLSMTHICPCPTKSKLWFELMFGQS